MTACKKADHKPYWYVVQRNYNQSAFNGYRRTPSSYSLVRCSAPGCQGVWRTRAAYVPNLPNTPKGTTG